MQLLNRIKRYAKERPGQVAIQNDSCEKNILTYGELDHFSDVLAEYINQSIPQDKTPIAVYGYKNIYMTVVFLACVKAGHPYCPIDSEEPEDRVKTLVGDVDPHIIFATESLDKRMHPNIITLDEIKAICTGSLPGVSSVHNVIKNEDVFLILFTSGSTGVPKGVELTVRNMDTFFTWFEKKLEVCKSRVVFLSVLPYTFDCGSMELYAPLWMGGASFVVERSVQADFKRMMLAFEKSEASAAMFSPYLAEICLLNKSFSEMLMPQLKFMVLAGEVLEHSTAGALLDRFPHTAIFDMYGPTEATIVVTEQQITKDMLAKYDSVPIGTARDGNAIEIWAENEQPVDNGVLGEIVIKGNAVARGYFRRESMARQAFIPYREGGIDKLAYKTGDKGFVDEFGVIHYRGRMDMQVQLQGYRVELSEIEKNFKKLGLVSSVAVLPKWNGDRVKHLVAFVSLKSDMDTGNNEKALVRMLKSELRELIPQYMMPKKIKLMGKLPQNKNGKIDRKKLEELI